MTDLGNAVNMLRSEQLRNKYEPPGNWSAKAACAGMDPEMFFPKNDDRRGIAAAKEVCRRCPVVAECLAYAMMTEPRVHGVWGGTTGDERVKLRRQLPGERTHCRNNHEYAVVGRDSQGACRKCRKESSARWAQNNLESRKSLG